MNELGFPHRTSVPGIPQTNTLAESRVKIVVYGTRTALSCAGLPSCFWPYAARHFCFALTIRHRGDSSAYIKQIGEDSPGMRIPFGCRVWFQSSKIAKNQPKKMEATSTVGVFMGYVLDPGANCQVSTMSSHLTPLRESRCIAAHLRRS